MQNINNNAAASKVLFPTAGDIWGRLLHAIADDTPPALKQARAELEGLEAAGKELDQLLEAEEIYRHIQAIRNENQEKIALIKNASNPTVIGYARERGWLPHLLSDEAVRLINEGTSMTDGYMDSDTAEW